MSECPKCNRQLATNTDHVEGCPFEYMDAGSIRAKDLESALGNFKIDHGVLLHIISRAYAELSHAEMYASRPSMAELIKEIADMNIPNSAPKQKCEWCEKGWAKDGQGKHYRPNAPYDIRDCKLSTQDNANSASHTERASTKISGKE